MARIVRAFHGTTYSSAVQIMSGQSPFHSSTKPGDWLGRGIYFFEESEVLAVDWALGRVAYHATMGIFDSPAVIAADIDLGHCLDLGSPDWNRNLRQIRQTLPRPIREQHAPVLTTGAGRDIIIGDMHMPLTSLSFNYADTTVIDALVFDLKQNGTPITTKRAAFVDGTQLYTNSYFFHRPQVHIAVLDQLVILNPILLHPVSVASAAANLAGTTP